jgi:hypothetical protein
MNTPPKALALAVGLAVAAALAGCGSTTTRTVTVTHTVAANTTATTTSSSTTSGHGRTSTTSTTTSSGPTATSTSTTASAPSASTTSTTSTTTTRTETGPAFVTTTPSGAGALAAAVALISHKGYSALDTSTYQPGDTLRVLIGRAAGGERAFFFDETSYLGTDASAPSAHITVFAQSDTEIVLSYAIYRPRAHAPSGVRLVHFALDMGMLNALDSIPDVSQRR